MKILGPLGWGGTTVTCKQCETRLLIETEDIGKNWKTDTFTAQCCVCETPINIDPVILPASVQAAIMLSVKINHKIS